MRKKSLYISKFLKQNITIIHIKNAQYMCDEHHTSMLASDHVDICMLKQQYYK